MIYGICMLAGGTVLVSLCGIPAVWHHSRESRLSKALRLSSLMVGMACLCVALRLLVF